MGLSNYPPGVTGNEPQITGDPPWGFEAECTRCRETFVPHSRALSDLIHGETELGKPCGGIGVMLDDYWSDLMEQSMRLRREADAILNFQIHGRQHPNCADPICVWHHPPEDSE